MIAKKIKEAFDPYYNAPIESWKKFANLCEEVFYKKNQKIKEANKRENYGYFLLEGAVGSFVWKKNNFVCLDIISIVINPTLFKKINKIDNWGSKSVMGERYWSERKNAPVPRHHNMPIFILTILQTIGGIILIIGLWKLKVGLTILGTIIVYLSKMWFLDRMVWIYEDMKNEDTK